MLDAANHFDDIKEALPMRDGNHVVFCVTAPTGDFRLLFPAMVVPATCALLLGAAGECREISGDNAHIATDVDKLNITDIPNSDQVRIDIFLRNGRAPLTIQFRKQDLFDHLHCAGNRPFVIRCAGYGSISTRAQ